MKQQQYDLIAEQLQRAMDAKSVARGNTSEMPRTMSVYGMNSECDRRLWYEFRWLTRSTWNNLQSRAALHTKFVRALVHELWAEYIHPGDHSFAIVNEHLTGHAHAVVSINGESFVLYVHVSTTGAKFNEIVGRGPRAAKPEQYTAMCIIGRSLLIEQGIHVTYNKNDESGCVYIFKLDDATGLKGINRAESVIYATEPPPRINDSPAWYVCKSCPANAMCHRIAEATTPTKSCRSCEHGYPVKNGAWYCKYFQDNIPANVIATGCDIAYTLITV